MPTLPPSESASARWGTGLQLQYALESMHRHLEVLLTPLDVTFAQCPALMFLLETPGATLGDVALATRTDAGAMTRLIERLRVKRLCSSARRAEEAG